MCCISLSHQMSADDKLSVCFVSFGVKLNWMRSRIQFDSPHKKNSCWSSCIIHSNQPKSNRKLCFTTMESVLNICCIGLLFDFRSVLTTTCVTGVISLGLCPTGKRSLRIVDRDRKRSARVVSFLDRCVTSSQSVS